MKRSIKAVVPEQTTLLRTTSYGQLRVRFDESLQPASALRKSIEVSVAAATETAETAETAEAAADNSDDEYYPIEFFSVGGDPQEFDFAAAHGHVLKLRVPQAASPTTVTYLMDTIDTADTAGSASLNKAG